MYLWRASKLSSKISDSTFDLYDQVRFFFSIFAGILAATVYKARLFRMLIHVAFVSFSVEVVCLIVL
jgi:hypothetical protein